MNHQPSNEMRRQADRAMNRLAMRRIGIVSSYDPNTYSAKVYIQPEGTESGWLPISTAWSGNGWGEYAPPTPGDIVEVDFQEGGKLAGIIGARHYGDVFVPLKVPSGERWTVHKSGSFLKFHNDGSIELNAAGNLNATVAGQVNLAVTGKVVASASEFDLNGNLNVTGTITASGDIYDQGQTDQSVNHIRQVYDIHTHPAPGGTTNVPNQQL
jgi:phage baseplate assembly protein gpV